MKLLFKLTLISIGIAIIATSSNAQPSITWQKTIGGSNDDYVNFGKIFTLQDGHYIIVGTSASNDGDFSTPGNSGGYDAYAAKFTKEGNLLWIKTYGGSGDEVLNGIIELPDHSFVAAGFTSSDDGDASGNHGQLDGWILQLDENGNLLQQQCYGGSGSDIIRGIVKGGNGNYIFAGVTDSNDGDIKSNHGSDDVWVAKWNQNGNLIWSKTYGGAGSEYVSGIMVNAANKVLVAGTTDSNDGIMSSNNGFVDGFVFQLNQAGIVQWSQCFGGSFLDVTQYGIEVASDGNLVLPMLTLSTDGDAAENHGSYDMLVVKVNSINGEKIWSHCYGSELDEGAFGAMAAEGGDLVLFGVFASDGGIDATYDAMAVKVDADGNEIWTKTFGGSDFDDAEDGVVTADGDYLLMCHTASYDGDVTNQHGPFDIWLVNLSGEEEAGRSHSSGIEPLAIQNNSGPTIPAISSLDTYSGPSSISIFPNPAKDVVIIQIPECIPNTGKVRIINAFGQPVLSVEYKREVHENIDLNVSDLPAGNYYVIIPGGRFPLKGSFVKN